jgi:hypothetical protein
MITIMSPSLKTIEAIEIYDARGMKVKDWEAISLPFQADVHNLSDGVYYLQYRNGGLAMRGQKLIKY